MVVVSCGKGSDDNGGTGDPSDQSNTTTTAKFLTADEFAKSTWTGADDVTLVVTKESMAFTYKEKVAVSKNTEDHETEKTVTVQIKYDFDEAKATFTGTGDDNKSYSGTLSSKDAMTFLQDGKSYSLNRKQ